MHRGHSSRTASLGDRPFTVTVKLATTPCCPMCGTRLRPPATRFVGSVAVCVSCEQPFAAMYLKAAKVLFHPNLNRHLSMDRGLLFWTPHKASFPTRIAKLKDSYLWPQADHLAEPVKPDSITELPPWLDPERTGE